MRDNDETRSRIDASISRVKEFVRNRAGRVITIKVQTLRIITFFVFEIAIGLGAYVYLLWFCQPYPFLEAQYSCRTLFGRFILSKIEFLSTTLIVGAGVFVGSRFLVKSHIARLATAVVLAALFLMVRHLVEASILFATALVIMTLNDLRKPDK
jgi:hypothetical protein